MPEKNQLGTAALQRNIRIIHALAFFHMFMLIVPVIVPFFESKGLSLGDIFYLQAVYAGFIVVLEAPSGMLADRFGRRTVLLIGSIAHGLGYGWLVFADSFVQLLVFECLLGVAASMMSGADLALLYDTEKALSDSEDAHTGSIAHLSSTKAFAEGAGALAGGALAVNSFDLMVAAQAGVAWVCLVLALLLHEPPSREAPGTRPLRGFRAIYGHLMQGDKILRQTFVAIPLYNLCTFHVAWLVQPYWEAQGLSLVTFGSLWFAQSFTVGMASQCGRYLERSRGPVFALTLIGLLPVLGHFGMAWLQGWAGILVGFILFFCRGLCQVIMVNALNRRVPGNVRATVNSLTSLNFRLGFVLTGPLLGRVAETQGLPVALSALGIASIVIFLVFLLPLIRSVQALQREKALANA